MLTIAPAGCTDKAFQEDRIMRLAKVSKDGQTGLAVDTGEDIKVILPRIIARSRAAA